MEDVLKSRDADYQAPEGVDWMRLGGNVANPVNWVAPEVGVARALPQAGALVARAAAAAPRTTAVVRGAAGGAVGGALQPAGEGESQGENAAVGGVFGAVAPPALKVLAKAGRAAATSASGSPPRCPGPSASARPRRSGPAAPPTCWPASCPGACRPTFTRRPAQACRHAAPRWPRRTGRGRAGAGQPHRRGRALDAVR
jgi:hypothetical protein